MKKILTLLLSVAMVLCMMPGIAFAEGNWGNDYETATEFTISNKTELQAFAKMVNEGQNFAGKTVKLTGDIAMSSSEPWVPIGSTIDEEGDGTIGANSFAGTFDGQNHTISNLICMNFINEEMTLYDATGLFGIVSGKVQNVNVTDANITAAFNGGVIVGLLNGGEISNCTASGSMMGFEYEGDLLADQLGGIVGNAMGTVVISDCKSAVNVVGGGNLGGILGNAVAAVETVTLINCVNTGEITGTENVGGIVGNLDNAEVKSCTNSGVITGVHNVGGIAGNISTVAIDGCRNSGSVSVKEDHGNQMFTGNIGGIVGNTSNQTLAINNCVNEGSVTGVKDTGGIVGLNQSVAISACTNTGNITGTENVGGISGSMQMAKNARTEKPGSITDCTSSGTITGTTNVGGIVGVNNAHTNGNDTTPSEIRSCTVTGKVTGTADNAVVGVIAGSNNTNGEGDAAQAGIIQNNYWPANVGANAVGSGAGSSAESNESVGNNSAWDENGNLVNPGTDNEGNAINFICQVTGQHNYNAGKCTICGEKDPNYTYIPPADPLAYERYQAKVKIDALANPADYDAEEQAKLKDIITTAKNSINKAKTKNEIDMAIYVAEKDIAQLLTIEQKEKFEKIAEIENFKLVARSKAARLNGRAAIRVNWFAKDGQSLDGMFDGYYIYRSTKRTSFSKTPFFKAKGTSKYYTNNKLLKKGTRYYYKVVGWKDIDGERYTTQPSLMAIRVAK